MANESIAFSNPTAPTDIYDDHLPAKKLSNEDFRTILMTPRASKDDGKPQTAMPPPKRSEQEKKKKLKRHKTNSKRPEATPDKSSNKVISTPYRDRARERREGKAPNTEEPDSVLGSTHYKSSNKKQDNIQQSDNRRQQIEESKFLGGDMKHTHLVKGLDYVLLEKARHDIDTKEKEAAVRAEKVRVETRKASSTAAGGNVNVSNDNGSTGNNGTAEVNSAMCRRIFRVLFDRAVPQRNANFYPGRMAYRIDLEDEFGEFDVPATIHRSILECPRVDDYNGYGVVSNNQKVIRSLTNILSYLRGERKQAKKAKLKEKVDERETKDVGKDYDMFADFPEPTNIGKSKDDKSHRISHNDSYHPIDRDERRSDKDRRGRYFDRGEHEVVVMTPLEKMKQTIRTLEKKNVDKKTHEEQMIKYLKQKTSTTGYDECYPEVMESFDAMGDSDDEADYTKMDMGNKKGPIGRWDFENQEEYSKYMSSKEALPKAAFQYGVKMADGRKTRRIHGKDEKAALDKEWKQIQELWKNRGEPPEKKAKF